MQASGTGGAGAFAPISCEEGHASLASTSSTWINSSVGTGETAAVCELRHPGPHHWHAGAVGELVLEVVPAVPGRFFPTQCVVGLAVCYKSMPQETSQMNLRDVAVHCWAMPTHSSTAEEGWTVPRLSLPLRALAEASMHLLGNDCSTPSTQSQKDTNTRVFLTLRFAGQLDNSGLHQIAAVRLFYAGLGSSPSLPPMDEVVEATSMTVESSMELPDVTELIEVDLTSTLPSPTSSCGTSPAIPQKEEESEGEEMWRLAEAGQPAWLPSKGTGAAESSSFPAAIAAEKLLAELTSDGSTTVSPLRRSTTGPRPSREAPTSWEVDQSELNESAGSTLILCHVREERLPCDVASVGLRPRRDLNIQPPVASAKSSKTVTPSGLVVRRVRREKGQPYQQRMLYEPRAQHSMVFNRDSLTTPPEATASLMERGPRPEESAGRAASHVELDSAADTSVRTPERIRPAASPSLIGSAAAEERFNGSRIESCEGEPTVHDDGSESTTTWPRPAATAQSAITSASTRGADLLARAASLLGLTRMEAVRRAQETCRGESSRTSSTHQVSRRSTICSSSADRRSQTALPESLEPQQYSRAADAAEGRSSCCSSWIRISAHPSSASSVVDATRASQHGSTPWRGTSPRSTVTSQVGVEEDARPKAGTSRHIQMTASSLRSRHVPDQPLASSRDGYLESPFVPPLRFGRSTTTVSDRNHAMSAPTAATQEERRLSSPTPEAISESQGSRVLGYSDTTATRWAMSPRQNWQSACVGYAHQDRQLPATPHLESSIMNAISSARGETKGPSVQRLVSASPPTGRSVMDTKSSARDTRRRRCPGGREGMVPPVGSFVVSKHHASRVGTGRRILLLERLGKQGLKVSVTRLDDGGLVRSLLQRFSSGESHGSSSGSSHILIGPAELNEIEVRVGLCAYHGAGIHQAHAQHPECCLTIEHHGVRVLAVEMQSVAERRLAERMLRHSD